MIFGVGTDIVSIGRIRQALARHGERFAHRILSPGELTAYAAAAQPAQLLAKRFAAKEAFGKAFGSGVAAPATLHSIEVVHDARGKPHFACHGELARVMEADQLEAHLSLSDELDYVVAFAVIERRS